MHSGRPATAPDVTSRRRRPWLTKSSASFGGEQFRFNLNSKFVLILVGAFALGQQLQLHIAALPVVTASVAAQKKAGLCKRHSLCANKYGISIELKAVMDRSTLYVSCATIFA